jgi:hypothetical protein
MRWPVETSRSVILKLALTATVQQSDSHYQEHGPDGPALT